MASDYKLLWLNGPMQGRELFLPEGDLTMGIDGDIIAPLAGHTSLSLTVLSQGITLNQPMTVLVEGGMHTGPMTIPLNQVIVLAGIGFMIGRADEALQWRPLPKAKLAGKTKWRLLLWLGFSLSIGLVSLFLLLLPPTSANQFEPHIWLKRQLLAPELAQIQTQWDSNGVLTLSGYCNNFITLSRLESELKFHGIRFRDKTICIEQLVANVQSVLVANGYLQAEVTTGKEAGDIIISGTIQSGKQWDTVTQQLAQLNGLRHWQVSNAVGGFSQQLIDALRNKGLLNGLMVEPRQNCIIITGLSQADKEQKINQVVASLSASSEQHMNVRIENIPVRENLSDYLPGQVVSYGGNSKAPFVELSNGVRLKYHSQLDNGYVVSHIDFNGLDLNRDGNSVHIPFSF
ncbi:MAG: type III secretion system inner membrane ring subunit SctD [Arsenophonus endosymbiont of Dermacentor nuttalli]